MSRVEVAPAADRREKRLAFRIRLAVFVAEQGVPRRLEFDGLDKTSEHLVATLENQAIGALRLRRIEAGVAKIERVAVLKEARGRKVGAALLQAALDRLRAKGIGEARLHAQTRAIPFYERFGFIAEGGVFQEDGIPHRAMRLRLTGGGRNR
jgi:predicted GNAT family N-acyltransferase